MEVQEQPVHLSPQLRQTFDDLLTVPCDRRLIGQAGRAAIRVQDRNSLRAGVLDHVQKTAHHRVGGLKSLNDLGPANRARFEDIPLRHVRQEGGAFHVQSGKGDAIGHGRSSSDLRCGMAQSGGVQTASGSRG